MTAKERIRTRVIFLGMIVSALVLTATLYSTQVVAGKKYADRAEVQYTKPAATFFDRGTIYFSLKDGTSIAGATIEQGNLIYMNGKQVEEPDQALAALSEFITIDEKIRSRVMANADAGYIELAHRISDTEAQSIVSLKLGGIRKAKESWRSYPGGVLASQTLGIIGEDSSTSTIRGKYGLERSYEEVLGRSGSGSNVSVFAELFAGVEDIFSGEKGEGDIVTTIEPTVASYLEKILSDTSTTWHPDEIGGIILDPKTGEIIAMSSLPTFNGNDTSGVSDTGLFSNPLVEHVYEMGSIVKPLTVAVGLDSVAISPSWTYEDTGTMILNSKTIGNWDRKARGRTGLQDLLSQSLNMGAATVGLKTGKENMSKYFDSLGLGEKTGIDMPNEATGLVKNLKAGQDIDIATASYGQGIAISPVAMARSLAVLANGGKIVIPHLVREIIYLDGTKRNLSQELAAKSEQVLRPETVNEVTSLLVNVVDKALKEGKIKNPRYTVAAKTGTAQIPDHVNGGYYTDRYLHSFFGYFPAYDPKFLVFLYQIHPKGAQYASETLTDPFDNLAKFLINYYDVPPDR
ncbi:MAG: penicillin-binding protein 2 [Candidatus Paceibacterota bacterium]